MEFTQEDVRDAHDAMYYPSTLSSELQTYVQMAVDHYTYNVHNPKVEEALREVFFTDKFSHKERISFIRAITDKDVFLNEVNYPFFLDIVKDYGPLLRAARCYKPKV